MRIEAGREDEEGVFRDPLYAALAAQSAMWPEVQGGLGDLEPGWITAEAFFADDEAIDEYLDYTGSFHKGTDRKTRAAAMMADYCYIVSMATVPLFTGFAIVPDLSPSLFALRFHVAPQEHDGRVFQVRRAHVRFLSSAYSAGDGRVALPSGAPALSDRALCDIYRHAVEAHCHPLVEQLHARTGLSKNALWRLAADAVAGRFLDAGRRFGCLERAKASAITILKQPGSPLCNRQLHFFDLTLHDTDGRKQLTWTFRARGGCCRYYTVEGGELCETCVLKKPGERDADLLELMRRRFEEAAADSA